MIITIETDDGRILIYDTRKKIVYEGIISEDTIITDEKLKTEIEMIVNNLLTSRIQENVKEREDAYDPDIEFSKLSNIIENYYDYTIMVNEFKNYAEKHYIPTITKLYELFDMINNNLTFNITSQKDLNTNWKLSDKVKITRASYDGNGYITLSYSGITPGYWETYSPELIREYIETLASKRRKIWKVYSKLSKEHPDEIDLNRVQRVITALEVFRKLER